MGQLNSAVQNFKTLHEDLVKHVDVGQLNQLGNAALCNYDDFLMQIQELNKVANEMVRHSGRRLAIGVQRGSADRVLLWRATVRIAVVQWDTTSNTVVSKRLLTLPQFLRVSSSIKQQLAATSSTDVSVSDPSSSSLRRDLTLSHIFNEMDEASCGDITAECCICLERQPDVMLPCAHAYCLPCIEQWNTDHKSCPICRESVPSTEDAWVLTDGPDLADVREEISISLMQLSNEPKS